MSQSAQPAPNPVLEFYNKWTDKTPYFTRTIVIATVVEYILSFFLPFEDYLGNVPRYTIMSFEVYRLILSPMVGNSFITMILLLISFPTMGTRLELSMGSASYLALLGTVSIATNVVFALICLLLYMVGTASAMLWSCQGFWTVLFALITIDCMQVSFSHFTTRSVC
jgi:membrane associated rhomboid family serine protease